MTTNCSSRRIFDRPLSWWINALAIATIGGFAIYGLGSAGQLATTAAKPTSTLAPYIQVIERNVLRCERGATLQASAAAEGYLIAWCE